MRDAVLKGEKGILALIFIIALALRVIAVMNVPKPYQIPLSDASGYDNLAMNLLAGKGFVDSGTGLPTSWRVPMYPAFLAFIYLIFGHNYLAVRIMQSIMGALLCVIIFYIAKIIFDRRTALLAATMLAFYQPYIFYSYYGGPVFLLSEGLFSFLLALLVIFTIKGIFMQYTLKNSIVAGVLLGLLNLTRPVMALFPLFLFGLLIYKNKYSLGMALNQILLLLIISTLVILPWTIRNYFIHKAFIPLSTECGVVLFGGNNPQARGAGIVQERLRDMISEEQKNRFDTMSELEKDKMFRQYAIDFLRKNYKILPKLFFKKLLVMWDVYGVDYDLNGVIKRRHYNIWYSIILMFGLFGIVKKIKVNINSLLLILLFLYYSFLAVVFLGEPRFRYPIEPFLIIFASSGIFLIYDAFKNKFISYTVISIIVAANLLLFRYSDFVLNWARGVIHSSLL